MPPSAIEFVPNTVVGQADLASVGLGGHDRIYAICNKQISVRRGSA